MTSTIADITIKTTPDAAPCLALADAIQGKRVLYVCHGLHVGRGIVRQMRDMLAPDTVKRFSIPHPSIELRTGGRIHFASTRSTDSGRGFDADTLVFDSEHISPDTWVALIPCINAADDPRVIITHRADDAPRV